jgi:hypothetical protein
VSSVAGASSPAMWVLGLLSCSRYPHPTSRCKPPIDSLNLPWISLQNIDTDQIIPAEYLTLVPSKVRPIACISSSSLHFRCDLTVSCLPIAQPDEYEKLGSYALIGLPDDLYPTRRVPGEYCALETLYYNALQGKGPEL